MICIIMAERTERFNCIHYFSLFYESLEYRVGQGRV
jgi:hypothetical protein